MSRRIAALICLLAFAFMVPSPVLAGINLGSATISIIGPQNGMSTRGDGIIGGEEAIAIFSHAFPDLTRGEKLEVEQEGCSFDGRPVWTLNSPRIGYRPGSENRVLSGSIDALSGRVLTMNYNPLPEYYRDKQVSFTREQAQQKAYDYLASTLPDLMGSLQLEQQIAPQYIPNKSISTYYSFSWKRLVNGVAVNWEGVMVGVDAYTGLITHYNCNLKDTQVSPGEIKVSRDEAIAMLLNQAGIYPAYKYSANGQIIPVYELNTDAIYVDALTGRFLDNRGQDLIKDRIKVYDSEFTPLLNGPAFNEPLLTEKVDPRQAQETARQFLLAAGFTGEIVRSGGGGGSGPGYKDEQWFYSPRNDQLEKDSGFRVEIDAYSGAVSGFYKNESQPGTGNLLGFQQALPIAWQAIKKYSPEKEKFLVLKPQAKSDYEPGKYTFTFIRLLNGLPFDRDYITVTVNRQNGDVLSYQVRWRPVQCSALKQLLDQSSVKTMLAQQLNVELRHMSPLDRNYQETGESRLVYLISSPRVDAVSGAMIYGGKSEPDTADTRAPFAQHWSAPALSMLNENGLFTGAVNPDENISRREALKTVLVATNPRAYYSYAHGKEVQFDDITKEDPDLESFALAASRGIISAQGRFDPEGYIHREELAAWVIKGLGYDNIAQIKNPITTPVKDAGRISPELQNYVGLAYGLGIIIPDAQNNLRPVDKVTRAEMAIMAGRIVAQAASGY
jgi:hypothetical protein